MAEESSKQGRGDGDALPRVIKWQKKVVSHKGAMVMPYEEE